MKLAYWLNTAWMWKCRSETMTFRRATRAVAQTQADLLRTILRQNALTLFGHKHDFRTITDVRQYQRRVPLSTFDDYSDWIELIAAGVPNVLTRQPVELLEPTSGTTRGEKWIPYTRSLREQFQRAIAAWIADLMSRRPAVRRGRAYWSVSPSLGPPRRTAAGIPVGFDDDTAYLGRWERFAASRVLAVPPSVAKLPDVAAFRYLTLLHLVRASDLTLISVWSPTFLTTLLARLDEWHERLCFDVQRGIAIPKEVAESGRGVLVPVRSRPDPPRAAQLRSIFAACRSSAEKLRMIWPRLALISCWADGPAEWAVREVQNLFPWVEVQPKGLIATEAFVSLPLVGRLGAALSLLSHFFEFEEVSSTGEGGDKSGALRMAHQLERGGRYRVVVTTGGGLYRYQLRDEVAVVGFENGCPLLRFLGKADCVSDLVGEKLSEPHVRQVLHRMFSSTDLSPTFALVVPVDGRPPRYRLYLQGLKEQHRSPTVVSLAESLEDGLSENPYYRYAVSLGQLAPAEVNLLDDASQSGRARYERRCLELGQRLGDIKPTTLDPRPGWAEVFARSAGVSSLTTDERDLSGSTG
ncbi:MAG: GH3 auxin-responsive promoter family protein [Planctomycetota bacterium]